MSDGAIAVIGAGIVGCACALALQRAGRQVLLIDQAEPGLGCSFGNAGHIATEQRASLASPETLRRLPSLLLDRSGPLALRPGVLPQLLGGWAWRFLRASLPANAARNSAILAGLVTPALEDLRALLQGTGAAVRLHERGHHLVWKRGDGAAILALAAAAGIEVRPWPAGDWPRLPDPVRQRIAGGLTYVGTGHVDDPRGVVLALRDALLAAGGREWRARVQALRPSGEGWEVRGESGSVTAARLVIAAGVDSGDLLSPLGYKVPLIAERGYHLAMAGQGGLLDAPLLFHERDVIVTPMASELRATTATEFSPRGAPPDPRRIALLRGHLRAVGLPIDDQAREWMGSRPTLPDYLPVIGDSRRHAGLFFAFGHQHLGLTLAGTTARLIRELILARSPPPAGLAIERFL